MSKLPLNTRIKLSVSNGIVTGAVAAWLYANAAGPRNEFWQGIHFHPLNYLAMILVCCGNTFAFFALLSRWAPIKGWKGFLLGGMVAVVGSFLCSLVMGIGTGRVGILVAATIWFIPVSGLIGAIAGLILAKVVRGQDQPA